MKKLIINLILFINSLNCSINIAHANTGKISPNQEIITFFDDYVQQFNNYLNDKTNTNVLKQMAANYHKSAFQVIPGVPIVPLDNPDELAKGQQGFLDYLVTQGVSSIKWQKVHIELLTDTTAYSSNVAVWLNKDGQIIKAVAADFFLLKAGSNWKIVTFISRTPQERRDSKQLPEVKRFLTKYLKNHNDALEDEGDAKQTMPALLVVADDLNIPSINVAQDGNFVLFTSKQQITDDTKIFIFDLKKQGVTHINYDKTQVKMLTDETALASNIASIRKADNSVLFKFGMTYLIHKSNKNWKIITRTMHSQNNILRIN